jgi:hypothetical protein
MMLTKGVADSDRFLQKRTALSFRKLAFVDPEGEGT